MARQRWSVEQRLELVRAVDAGETTIESTAKKLGLGMSAIYKRYQRTKREIANGVLNPQTKELDRSNAKRNMSPVAKRIIGQISDICERHGYDPAEGVIAYRGMLEGMVKEREAELLFTSGAELMQGSSIARSALASSLGDGDKTQGMRDASAILDLKREMAAIDKELLPYIYPKLTSSSVKVEQEKPPLLVIESPVDRG